MSRPLDLGRRAAVVLAGVAALFGPAAAVARTPVDAAPSAGSQFSAGQQQSSRLWLGAAWYPEQWPQSHWERDLELMKQAGFNVVRVGEFGWSSMEPAEGRYDFAWLEQAIRMAERHGIKVVLGTPTDAPPAWLTTRYPEVLRVGADGLPSEHGGRRQFSYASDEYRRFSRGIVAEMVRRFGRDPNVIGWQIGNEYTDESFDAGTRKQFQDWLRARYGTLDALNAAWTTPYWSQTYSDWSQIPLNASAGNPGWMLDHRRFVTDTWRSFQKNQIDVIRAGADAGQFITTNVGGLGVATNWDKYAVNADLDVASWDPYVGTGHLDAYRSGAVNDAVRGWKRKNFWVMETQPGFVNWSPLNNALYRGETRAMAWQEVGHGADAILYWQWRSALNGQEQYHGALVGPDGEPLPLYGEVQQLGRDFAAANDTLVGTSPVAEVAIASTYDSRWAIEFQPHTKAYDQLQVQLGVYRPLKDRVGLSTSWRRPRRWPPIRWCSPPASTSSPTTWAAIWPTTCAAAATWCSDRARG